MASSTKVCSPPKQRTKDEQNPERIASVLEIFSPLQHNKLMHFANSLPPLASIDLNFEEQ